MTSLRTLMLAAALAVLAACATVPTDYPRTPSYALEDTGNTELGRSVGARIRGRAPGESGFYVLADGVDALGARLALARRAERSIDAQYFIVQGDLVGTHFIDHLLDAADRGVRVRLLIDDIDTIGDDEAIAAIASHPNFELSVFNPFAHRSSARYVEFVTDLDRVDHRMHNKSFTVDNQVSIVGGRNIGDEYFDANPEFEFGDLDVAAFGPVAQEVSKAFDTYWNSEFAIPAGALIDTTTDPDAVRRLRQRHARMFRDATSATYRGALESSIIDRVLDLEFPLFWGVATVVFDDPDKVEQAPEEITTIRSLLAPKVRAAGTEFLVVTPYFVPLATVAESFREMRNRGVRIVTLTNSLASTDMIAVHGAYAKYRRKFVEMGVEMHEVIPDASFDEEGKTGLDFTLTALHLKAFVIDRRQTFIGSFNWDPRSALINTEVGLFIDSPALAEWAAGTLESRLPEHSYRVRINEDDAIEWVRQTGEGERVYDKEPETGAWRRFKADFYGILPVEEKL
jgi:putative cardiolipin synthase